MSVFVFIAYPSLTLHALCEILTFARTLFLFSSLFQHIIIDIVDVTALF